MKKAGELPCVLWSYNTCEHHGRVFSFAPDDQRKLVVSEVFLGDEVEVKQVNTGVDCKCSSTRFLFCCSFGDRILVMAGEENATDFFCALLSIDPGELTEESIHIEGKKVTGWKRYEDTPFLVQISENEVWASFYNSSKLWIGKLKGKKLVMKKKPARFPMLWGFGIPPLRLPDGKSLVAGEWPYWTNITLITPGKRFSLEKVGDIPAKGISEVSMILVKERFLVGFGGMGEELVDDMWIFDLQTHRASPVIKGGDWHPATSWPFLAVKDGSLYIAAGLVTKSVHSITLQHLSELVQDLDFQPVFQAALGLELRRYPVVPQKARELRGMRDLGGYFYGYRSSNTVDHQGRVFHFSQRERKLCVTEILFGSTLKTKTVDTGVDCKTDDDKHISCCPLGDKLLVMAGRWNEPDMFCALVTIDPGELTEESIHIEEKRVSGCHGWGFGHYPAQLAENKVWVSFDLSDEIWIGEIKGDELAMTKHSDHLPMAKGLGATPLLLPNRKFLMTGQFLSSTTILLLTMRKHLYFQELGDIPGTGREGASTVLVGGRFVVGFGGVSGITFLESDYVDAMWIFDLKTHKVSPVTREGEWHPGGPRPVLVVRDKELYVIGGGATTTAHCLSFTALSQLLQYGGVRSAFCFHLSLPLPPNEKLGRNTIIDYIPNYL